MWEHAPAAPEGPGHWEGPVLPGWPGHVPLLEQCTMATPVNTLCSFPFNLQDTNSAVPFTRELGWEEGCLLSPGGVEGDDRPQDTDHLSVGSRSPWAVAVGWRQACRDSAEKVRGHGGSSKHKEVPDAGSGLPWHVPGGPAHLHWRHSVPQEMTRHPPGQHVVGVLLVHRLLQDQPPDRLQEKQAGTGPCPQAASVNAPCHPIKYSLETVQGIWCIHDIGPPPALSRS